MSEYKKGDAYECLKQEFMSESFTDYRIEIAKTLAIVDALNDLEGHLSEQIFHGTRKRA